MKTTSLALLLAAAAAALTSCAPAHVTGEMQVTNGKTSSLRVETPSPTTIVLEIWNDGPDTLELTRTDNEGKTTTTLTNGATYKFEHRPTDVIAVDMVTAGEARLRYAAHASARLTVSTSEK